MADNAFMPAVGKISPIIYANARIFNEFVRFEEFWGHYRLFSDNFLAFA